MKVTTYGANSQKKSANKPANSQKEKGGASKNGKVKKNQPDSGTRSKSPETKPIRGSRTAPPTNAFQPGNQNALKHGGYGRRMLLSDAITEDAQMLTLDDELFWLRAASLTAAENIGRWQTELETADSEQAKDLHDLISQAQKAMHRNTARIESLEYTKASIIKQRADVTYREAATDKVSLEADRLRRDAGIDDGNGERDLNDFYSDIQTDAEPGPA
ncbi:hypothetical protein [Klebsiella pneumoniae]|uniref:hypothetical protein n=1 Tax=Klebsiella pneumoniae TaxID=573 RepID=UPI00387E4E16